MTTEAREMLEPPFRWSCPQCNYSVAPHEILTVRKHFNAHALECVRCLYRTETKPSWEEAKAAYCRTASERLAATGRAWQWHGDILKIGEPDWVAEATEPTSSGLAAPVMTGGLTVFTARGKQRAKPGDWIVSLNDEIYLFTEAAWAVLSTATTAATGERECFDRTAVEAGAQALANDVWHPPQPLVHLSSSDANKFRRQARIVLDAATAVSSTHPRGGGK